MLVTVGGDQGAHLEEAGLDVRDRRLPQFNMGADSAVEVRTEVAIVAFYADTVWEAAPNNVSQHRHSVSAAVLIKRFSVFVTPAADVADRQEELFCFATTRTCPTVVIVDHLFQFRLIFLLTPKG